jgi:hypothetical protein
VSMEKRCCFEHFFDARVNIEKLMWAVCLHWILKHAMHSVSFVSVNSLESLDSTKLRQCRRRLILGCDSRKSQRSNPNDASLANIYQKEVSILVQISSKQLCLAGLCSLSC